MELLLENNEIIATPVEIDLTREDLTLLTLSVLFDCCTELVNEEQTLPYVGLTVTIPHTINEYEDQFVDGVYQIKLRAEFSNGTIIEETKCIFVNTTLKCQIADYIVANPGSEIGPLYVLLLQGNSCECNCATSCEILKRVRKILGMEAASCSNC